MKSNNETKGQKMNMKQNEAQKKYENALNNYRAAVDSANRDACPAFLTWVATASLALIAAQRECDEARKAVQS